MQNLLEKRPHYHWMVFAAVALGTFMSTLDGSIVNVALPTMADDFRVGLPEVQWIVSAYLLTISSLLPIMGSIADIYGRSRVFSLGFLVFIIGSLFCGFSHSIGFIIFARILQAVGGSMLMANSMAIITAVFPPDMRGRALGTMGTVVAAGSITGPGVGGLLIARLGWPSIFFVNLPVGILGILAGFAVLPKDKKAVWTGFDFPGALLFSTGIVSLLLGFSLVRDKGWASPTVGGLICGAAVLLAIFIRWELHHPQPLIDISLFKIKVFAAGSAASLISFIVIFTVNILMPFYLQEVLKLSPQRVGLLMTPFPLAMAFTAPFSGWLSDRVGPIMLTSLGMVLGAVNIYSMTWLTAATPIHLVAIRLAVMGFTTSLFQSPNNSAVLGSVPRPRLGVASGLVATMRNIGMVLGISLSVTLFTSRQSVYLAKGAGPDAAFLHGFHFSLTAAALLCIVGALVSIIRGENKKVQEREFPTSLR